MEAQLWMTMLQFLLISRRIWRFLQKKKRESIKKIGIVLQQEKNKIEG
jgi:hypothetical protein